MSDFRFADPQWVHALWLVIAFVALLFWLDRRGGSALEQLVSLRLQTRLVQRSTALNRRLSLLLLGLAGVFLVLALMRPQWGLHYVATPRVGAEIMICLDVSKSMLAEDVAPNRLERAKADIRDLLPYLEGDHVGLIVFAGRASVLAPLTPDFGFLRLVLDGVNVNSVTRGGTRLEEPIRKAVRGFGSAGDVSRTILLITDGEDHDSFPLEAAKAAAEAGVRVIAMGFGDEAGSEVMITDPATGARTLLRDSAGSPVRSRLDGATLREIALLTGGAYIPAGTGVLDLASIYETHIARLTRGRLEGRGKAVRHEGYQWAVLLALVSLLLSVGVASRGPRALSDLEPAITRGAAALLLLGALALVLRVGPAGAEATAEGAQESAPGTDEGTDATPEEPREIYNRAVTLIEGGPVEEAEPVLLAARSAARDDAELRYRASYNLGYQAAARADELMEAEPEQALQQLRRSADWFREAARLRPQEPDPRHNLAVVLQRELVLADSLAERDPADWAAELESLAQRQRELIGSVGAMLEQLGTDPGPDVIEGLRRELNGLAATQRTLLSDADGLASRVGVERDALQAQPEEELTPEDAVRLIQLENLQHYLHRARERMGHARTQLRRREPKRAYRRASIALAELRRAQDQLRNPVEVLDGVIREATETARSSALLAASQSSLPGLEQPPQAPAWLTLEYLSERQVSVEERTGELHARLQAGLAAESEQPADESSARLLERLREAEPLVGLGRQQLQRATQALEGEDLEAAGAAQRAAIQALLAARELFLDLRQLIETTYADQVLIGRVLSPDEQAAPVALAEFLPGLRSLQRKNIARGERLSALLEAARGELAASADSEPAAEAERERLSAADQILEQTRAAMADAQQGLGESAAPSPRDLPSARAGVTRAVAGLEALRRLFFSIVEHLRETARRQLELNDETQDAAALSVSAPAAAAAHVGPLVPRQTELAQTAGALADALEEQSRQDPGAMVAGPNTPPQQAAGAQGMGERLRRAGEIVLGAQSDMELAVAGLEAAPPATSAARERQDAALTQLIEAVALLTPPPEQGEQEQQQGGEQRQDSAQQAQEERGAASESSPASDPAQLLQAVRDRAAERQRNRAERSRYETVEKDW